MAIGLTPQTAKTVQQIITERKQVGTPPDSNFATSGPRAANFQWVSITSTSKTLGYYPGKLYWFAAASQTYTEYGGDIWVRGSNNATLSTGSKYNARQAESHNGRPVFIVDDVTGSGTLTLTSATSALIASGVSTLRWDLTDGLSVTSLGGGAARIDLDGATATQSGIVTTGTQEFAGLKMFHDDVEIWGGLEVDVEVATPLLDLRSCLISSTPSISTVNIYGVSGLMNLDVSGNIKAGGGVQATIFSTNVPASPNMTIANSYIRLPDLGGALSVLAADVSLYARNDALWFMDSDSAHHKLLTSGDTIDGGIW